VSRGETTGHRWLQGALLGGSGAALAAFLYTAYLERMWIRLDRYTVRIGKCGLPPEGITLLHLSDFHMRAGGRVQARKIANLRRILAHEQYDLALLTGDLIHDAEGFPAALAAIADLHPRLGGYACPGNHDYMEYSVWGMFGEADQAGDPASRSGIGALPVMARNVWDFGRKVLRNELVRLPVTPNDVPAMNSELQARGITPLINRAVRVQDAGLDIWLAGIDDPMEGRPDLRAALADVPEGAPLVLLAHNPDVWLEAEAQRADLILAGHTHGGQIRLPLVGAMHTQGTHLTRRRPAGWFNRGNSRMFVSRGIGESIPLRFGVPPQVALIRLMPAAPGMQESGR